MKKFDAHEDFVGLHKVESIGANVLVGALKDVLLKLNLSVTNYRGGNSVMMGQQTWLVLEQV